ADVRRRTCLLSVSAGKGVRLQDFGWRTLDLRLFPAANDRAVIFDRAAETLFEADLGLEMKALAGLGYVGLAIADVAWARIVVLGLDLRAQELVENGDEFKQRGPRTIRNVEYAARDIFGFGGQEVGLNDIADEREVTRLLAIAENHR